MATLVLTVIGDDRPGLVDTLASAVEVHHGNWDRSHLARLGGKFAGIVVVDVPDGDSAALIDALHALDADGLLEITVEHAGGEPGGTATFLSLQLIGHDRPGIVHEIAHALASSGVSIEEMQTETMSAPMAGEQLFEATAVLRAPAELPLDDLRHSLEALANELMVDIELHEAPADS